MKKTTIFFLVISSCLAILAGNVYTQENQLLITEKVIPAIGTGGDRTAAIRDAQRNAVEQFCGVFIKGQTEVDKFQLVRDVILSKTEGFISSYEILHESLNGNNYRVKIAATIPIRSMQQALRAYSILYKEIGYPKIMVVIDETSSNKGKQEVLKASALQTSMENALIKKGFMVVAKDYSDKLRTEERSMMADLISDQNKAAQIALKYGADYVITGQCNIKYVKFDTQSQFHESDAVANSRIIITSTAQIMASEQNAQSGGGITAEGSAMEAAKRTGDVISRNIIKGIIQNWQRIQREGNHFVMTLYGIKSYQREGRAFINFLNNQVAGIASAERKSYGGGRLELDVRYQGNISALEESIFNLAKKNKTFKNLDLRECRGNNLVLELRRN